MDHWNGVADSNRVSADDDFLDDQPKDFLPLDHIQSLRSGAESAAKLRECFGKSQVSGLVFRRDLQRVKLGFDGLLLFAQIRYALSQLGQSDQFFLIRSHKPCDVVLQTRVLLP